MNREIALTIMILVSTMLSIITTLYAYSDNTIKQLDDEIIKTKTNDIDLISSQFEQKLQYVIGIVDMSSKTSQIKAAPYSNLISEHLRGISEDADYEKRELAKKLLVEKFDIEYVFYVLPDGTLYFLEPFDSQIKLSRSNFAFRDWYSGAINTGSTYVSGVYVSVNQLHTVIGIATPIYKDDGHLNGIFGVTLNLGELQKTLSNTNLRKNEYLLIVDHDNNIVADSRNSNPDIEIRKFGLSSNELKSNNVDTTTREINGKNMFLAFKTVPVGTHEWLIISIQPHADAFESSIDHKNEIILIIVIMSLILGISGFFIIRKINTNLKLSDKLRYINSELEFKTEQIKQIDIKKEEFSAMVTHELKTPLTPILWSVKILKDEINNPEHLELIESIEKNTKHLELLISDIMDARKLDLGKMKFNIESVSLDDLFADLESAYKNQLLQKGITFTIQSEMGMKIRSDKDRLRQVFDNLIGNAIKFVPSGTGVIQVSAKKEYDHIIISVKDNGPGIPPEKQNDLFKKFYQVDTSERRIIGGTGLGLAISKGIMDNLKGKIWLESDGKTGTTVYLSLPF